MPREPVSFPETAINAERVRKHKKKRGVYVEKKLSKLSAHSRASSKVYKPSKTLFKSRNVSPQNTVVPKRPPANSFVNSVLNILSQTQTGSTFSNPVDVNYTKPGLDVPELTQQIKLKDLIKKNKMNNKGKKSIELKTDMAKTPANHSPKRKYKSKVLNAEHRSRPNDVVVLQSQNGRMARSPSICSSSGSRGGLSWMDCMEDSDDVFVNNEYTNDSLLEIDYENNQVVKEINEGKKINEERSKHDAGEKNPEKVIYNFFVDVLKKIKPDQQLQELQKPCQIKESTDDLVKLEIDENVANKLAFSEKRDIKKVSIYGIEGDDELSDSSAEHFEIDAFEPKRPALSAVPVRRMNPKSYSFTHPKPKPMPESSSLTKRPYKNSAKASNKKRFLALLKRQLASNIDIEPKQMSIEQPQSLYEALRIMAREKSQPLRVRFKEAKSARRSKPKQIKKDKKFNVTNNFDIRYPIEAEVDSRYVSNVYASPGGSFSSLQVYGEDYIFKGDMEYDNVSETSDLCNRFSIASFGWQSSKNIRSRSSPLSIAHKRVGHRSTSPFSGRSGRF